MLKKYGEKKSILFLGRTNYDLELLKGTGLFKEKKNNRPLVYLPNQNIPVEFLTVHKSKGLEADNVVILNFNNSLLGFPNKIADDPLLELVLSNSDTYLYGEERRLLYVALTRTRNEVFLITDASKPSEFKREFDEDPNAVSMPMDYSETISMSCPKCKTGKLVERFSPKYQKPLVGCTNYPACTFFTWDLDVLRNPKKCKACGGFMTLRKGSHGLFYGCMNYPTCKNTMEIE
jgi:DNA helicase-4